MMTIISVIKSLIYLYYSSKNVSGSILGIGIKVIDINEYQHYKNNRKCVVIKNSQDELSLSICMNGPEMRMYDLKLILTNCGKIEIAE